MSIEDLREKLDVVLDQLYASRTPLSYQEELQEEFISVYRELFELADDELTADHAYFFTIPQHPIYRRLLDDDLLDILGAGALYTLQDTEYDPSDIASLQEQLCELEF